MSKLQEQADTAWYALFNIRLTGYCAEDTMDAPKCYLCPDPEKSLSVCAAERAAFLRNWLSTNGFPSNAPHVYTVADLSQQITKGSSIASLALRIADHVEAVQCPECGEILYRETRKRCVGCGKIYQAERWAAGEPCECGSMDAKYAGKHSANRFGNLEYRQCETSGCRWENHYRPLTAQELADAAQVLADEQWAAARTCPDCGEVSGNNHKDGVYLPIEDCLCGWEKKR